MPHGDDGSSVGVTTTHAVMDVSPAATAATTAPRSAQIVAPYEADSTLHPATIRPLPHSTAAPTWKDEYGARARDCAVSAASSMAANCGSRRAASALSISSIPWPATSHLDRKQSLA